MSNIGFPNLYQPSPAKSFLKNNVQNKKLKFKTQNVHMQLNNETCLSAS